jgi:hypothetical protein
MRVSARPGVILVIGLASALLATPPTRGSHLSYCTISALQPFTDPEDNFEVVLGGNLVSELNGPFLNGFPTPTSVTASADMSANTTTVGFFGHAVSASGSTQYTFGFGVNTPDGAPGTASFASGVQDVYWTSGLSIEGHLSAPNVMISYSIVPRQALITLRNDPGTFSLYHVGYLVTNTPFGIGTLNGTDLPPGAFLASGIADGTQLGPGASASFTINGIQPGQYVTIFTDSQFSGPSSGNPYTGFTGQWAETQALPEPTGAALALIGALGLLARRLRTCRCD